MENIAQIDIGYEFYQIIKDFDNPIQIFREAFQNSIDEGATEVWCRVWLDKKLGKQDLYIDIWDNGDGLSKKNLDAFFGLAKSTKINDDKTPKEGKLGYKGHGTKIFFNAEEIIIATKAKNDGEFGILLTDPIQQIRETGSFKYSNPILINETGVELPAEWNNGFYLRIKNPYYFKTQHTLFMLNHLYLRDYSKWFTVFGNIKTDPKKAKHNLHLQGLNIDSLKENYFEDSHIDPIPVFETWNELTFEKIRMGHYFPDQRITENQMKQYADKVGHDKSYYEYYSREIINEKVTCDNNVSFDFVFFAEGYETKRRYDLLLSKRGKSNVDKNITHTDSLRYGLWACKGGVPIEKIDDWIEGGRGVGTYSYMHGFVDCDNFELTANRGSVRNTDLEIQEIIKRKINEILGEKKIQNLIAERQEIEEFEKKLRSSDEDGEELKRRFKESKNRNYIVLPNGKKILEPTKGKSGYSESETLIVLIYLVANYPDLFNFEILDYNTTKGVDFVVEKNAAPKYIELKGTMWKKINHSFRNISKFICYDIELKNDETLTDIEDLTCKLKVLKDQQFQSYDKDFKGKAYTAYQLIPENVVVDNNIEIICLKKILTEIVEAKVE